VISLVWDQRPSLALHGWSQTRTTSSKLNAGGGFELREAKDSLGPHGRQFYGETACTARSGLEDTKGPFSALWCIFILPKLNCAYVPLQASLSLRLLVRNQTSSKISLFIRNSKDI